MTARPTDPLPIILALAVLLAAGGFGLAQPVPPVGDDPLGAPLLLRNTDLLFADSHPSQNPVMSGQTAHIQLFRMPTGFLTQPIGLDDDESSYQGDTCLNASTSGIDDDLDSRVQFAMGLDNPYFDLHRRGDPGGVGYYKLYSQFQLLGGRTDGLSFNCMAVAPAGLEYEGLGSGDTVFTPSLAWFQQLGNGAALQGFVGKHMPAGAGWDDKMGRGFNYGLAVQSLLSDPSTSPSQALHLFVEALGGHRLRAVDGPTDYWEVLPGVHWRLTDDCWLSGGVSFPLGASRWESKLWQITGSWQF